MAVPTPQRLPDDREPTGPARPGVLAVRDSVRSQGLLITGGAAAAWRRLFLQSYERPVKLSPPTGLPLDLRGRSSRHAQDDAVFVAEQRVRVARPTKDGAVRRYALAGLVVCGVCGRRMDAHWVHGRPGYWCRHGYTSATPRPPGTPGIVYVREDCLRDALPGLLDAYDGEMCVARRSTQVDRLRMCGLEIVCGEHDRVLRSTTIARDGGVSLSRAGQQSLPLG